MEFNTNILGYFEKSNNRYILIDKEKTMLTGIEIDSSGKINFIRIHPNYVDKLVLLSGKAMDSII